MKNKIIYIIIIFVIFFGMDISNAQNVFRRNLFGTNNTEAALDIKQTIDGGYIVTGVLRNTSSFLDVVLLKLNPYGNLSWAKAFGSPGTDIGQSVIQSDNGDYILTGMIYGLYNEIADFYVVKTNSNGDSLWTKTYGTNFEDHANKIIELQDGYLIAGTKNEPQDIDILIIKITSTGEIVWSKNFSGTGIESASDMCQLNDGSIIVTGYIEDIGGRNMLLMKLNSSGNLLWAKSYDNSNNPDFSLSVSQTEDNGFILCGKTKNTSDIGLIKTDSNGNLIWSKTFGGSYNDYGTKVISLSVGGYIVTGWYSIDGHINPAALIKLNSNGDTIFTRLYHSLSDTLSIIGSNSIDTTSDKGYVIAGSGSPGISILKTDSLGRTCEYFMSGIPVHNTLFTVYSPLIVEDTVTVTTRRGGSIYPTYLQSYGCSPLVNLNIISNIVPDKFSLSQNYPNPFNPTTNLGFGITELGFVSLKVYDALGREVATLVNEKLSPGIYEVEFTGNNFPSGIYFYKLSAGEYSEVKRMILLK